MNGASRFPEQNYGQLKRSHYHIYIYIYIYIHIYIWWLKNKREKNKEKFVWSRRIRRMEERRDVGQLTNLVGDREEDS